MTDLYVTKRSQIVYSTSQKKNICKLFEISGFHGGCDIAPCSLVRVVRRFRGAYCLHHHGTMIMDAVRISEMSAPARLHGATSQKTLNFILQAYVIHWFTVLRVVCIRHT
jgi:hypothetical protein